VLLTNMPLSEKPQVLGDCRAFASHLAGMREALVNGLLKTWLAQRLIFCLDSSVLSEAFQDVPCDDDRIRLS
jgi:hypothetical protein